MTDMLKNTTTWAFPSKIAVVVDTPGWYDDHAARLARRLNDAGHSAMVYRDYADIPKGDIAFYLSCMRITPAEVLSRNKWNYVVHASDLPKGRGFSPLVWQILEGADEIPVTMISMVGDVDAGDIVAQTRIRLFGHELNTQLRDLLAQAIEDLCIAVANAPTAPVPKLQQGDPTWYRRRRPADSAIDPQISLAAQFDLLRVVDNDRYPAYFDHRGHRYILKIEDMGPSPRPSDRNEHD